MYTVPFSRLAAYAGALPPPEATAPGSAFPRNQGVGAGKQDNHYTAMHAAMRCAESLWQASRAMYMCCLSYKSGVGLIEATLRNESQPLA